MDWVLPLAALGGGLILGLVSGLPVFVAFALVNLVGLYLIGGFPALLLLPNSMMETVGSFSLVAVVLFVLMGETIFQSGFASKVVDAFDAWVGGLRGRLSYVTVVSAAGFGALSGSAMAATATLGATLAPEMHRRGYSGRLIAGPIVGAGGLAMIMPPSTIAVILGTIANISIAQLLIGGIIPAVLIAIGYGFVIWFQVRLEPALAPSEQDVRHSWRERLNTLPLILPAGFLVFMVLGLILLGVATPTESAALGALGAFVVSAANRSLSLRMVRATLTETVKISSGLLLIIGGSSAFSQVLAFTGASSGVVRLIGGFDADPLVIVAAMMFIVLFLGMFMDQVSIILITIPIFMPVVGQLGLEPVWFGILMLVSLQIANETPPFGIAIYIAQTYIPSMTSTQIIRAVIPFLLVDIGIVVTLMIFDDIVLWLPRLVLQ